MRDKHNVPYAKLSMLRAGDKIRLDSGFTCIEASETSVCSDKDGLFFHCAEGHHYLSGQADNGEDCVGVYRA